MSAWEKEHIVAAYRFELGKVDRAAHPGADGRAPQPHRPQPGRRGGRRHRRGRRRPRSAANHGRVSPALSQASQPGVTGIAGRKVAVLVANGVDADSLEPRSGRADRGRRGRRAARPRSTAL